MRKATKSKAKVGARELERQIFHRESIHVILLTGSKTEFEPWPYKVADSDDNTLARFRDQRLIKHIGKGVEFMILKACDEITNNGRWSLGSLRRMQLPE